MTVCHLGPSPKNRAPRQRLPSGRNASPSTSSRTSGCPEAPPSLPGLLWTPAPFPLSEDRGSEAGHRRVHPAASHLALEPRPSFPSLEADPLPRSIQTRAWRALSRATKRGGLAECRHPTTDRSEPSGRDPKERTDPPTRVPTRCLGPKPETRGRASPMPRAETRGTEGASPGGAPADGGETDRVGGEPLARPRPLGSRACFPERSFGLRLRPPIRERSPVPPDRACLPDVPLTAAQLLGTL